MIAWLAQVVAIYILVLKLTYCCSPDEGGSTLSELLFILLLRRTPCVCVDYATNVTTALRTLLLSRRCSGWNFIDHCIESCTVLAYDPIYTDE